MADSFKIGSILGIDIELHWTFIALMLLSLFLSLYIFLLILLLFVCVLVHELAHSVTARRNGIGVRKIILYILGGASIIDEIDIDPKVEFNIAVVGPLTSLFLGTFFGTFAAALPASSLTPVLQFLFIINIILGVFNLLPAFPTDGGRVFRSYLERKYDFYKATLLTVKASEYTMGLFVLGTIVYVILLNAPFYSKEFVFIWNIFIVVFLYGGAQNEKQAVELKRAARGVSVRDVASRNFAFVKPGSSVADLYAVMKRTKKHILVTELGGHYLLVDLFRKKRLSANMRISDIAVKIPSADVHTNVVDVLGMMETSEAGISAITSGKRLVGIATAAHIQAFLSLHVLKKHASREQ